MIDITKAFDTTNALSGLYLWLLFGFLSVLVNCDLQRFIKQHPVIMHLVGILAFFFLFTIIDTDNKVSIGTVWIQTLFVYFIFMLMIKSKWYFVVPVIILLLIDQSIKKELNYELNKMSDKDAIEKKREYAKKISSIINIIIIVIIVIGTIHYAFLQKLEYKENFSFYKFFLGVSECKSYMPDYNKMKK